MRNENMLNFLKVVKFAARLLNYDIFCVVEENGVGYVACSNSGSAAINNLRNAQSTWEKANG